MGSFRSNMLCGMFPSANGRRWFGAFDVRRFGEQCDENADDHTVNGADAVGPTPASYDKTKNRTSKIELQQRSRYAYLVLATMNPKAKGDKKGEMRKPIVQMFS